MHLLDINQNRERKAAQYFVSKNLLSPFLLFLLCAKSLQMSLTLCDPMNCSPPGSSVHGDTPSKNSGVGCHALLQGIFPTQGSSPGLLQHRQILYCLSHQGTSPVLPIVQHSHCYTSLLQALCGGISWAAILGFSLSMFQSDLFVF